MKHIKFFLIMLLSSSALFAVNVSGDPFSKGMAQSGRIVVENRVLACINDHPISVIDLMKKMDTIFYHEFPHLIDSEVAKFQFYKANWQSCLQEMVNNELIFADAQDRKIKVTHGDLREEIDRQYGPEIITNIDKIGLTLDEVKDLVEKEISVRRMIGSILYLKGLDSISPSRMLAAYEEYIAKNKKPDFWTYYIISFRGPSALENAQMVSDLLKSKEFNKKDFKAISYSLQDKIENFKERQISISKEFHLKGKEISQAHKNILNDLQIGTFSSPTKEYSRSDSKDVYRIFFLKKYQEGGVIELAEIENQLKESITNQLAEKEIVSYIEQLREKFGVSKSTIEAMTPEGFEPFHLK